MRTLPRLILCLTVALAPFPCSAQADPALVRRIDSIFSAVDRITTPGCAVGVDRAGVAVVRRAYGMANLETMTPWTVGTLSESGSVAKQFTAAALVLLARDGVLSLDDDIAKWIPETKSIGKRITIRHLLTHTSGLPDRYTLHAMEQRAAGEVDHNNAEVMDVVSRLRELNFDPGEDYLYSNTGYIVAATVLERASGKSLQAFTDARIFKPLGMTAVWREDHRAVVPGRASAYTRAGTVWRNDHPFTRVIGSGGLLVTVDDFLKWQAAMQRGGDPWGAVRDSLERMGKLNDGTELDYGLGVGASTVRGVRRVAHTGSTGGYRSALVRYPDQRIALAFLCNGGSAVPGDLGPRLASAVLGSTLAAVPAEPSPYTGGSNGITPSQLAGAYHAPRTEEVMVLYLRNGQLADSTANNVELIPVAADRFKYRGSDRHLTVLPAAGGAPTRVRLEAPNTRAVEYVSVSRDKPSAQILAGYAGTYRSPELGSSYQVSVSGDTLRLERGWRGNLTLRPLYRDGFLAGPIGIVRFTRNPQGRVTGFVVWAGRVRHLRFDKQGPGTRD